MGFQRLVDVHAPFLCALPGVTIHNTTAQTAWRAFQPEASGAIRAVRIDRRHHNAVMPCDLPGALQGKFLITPANTVRLFHRDQHFAGGKKGISNASMFLAMDA